MVTEKQRQRQAPMVTEKQRRRDSRKRKGGFNCKPQLQKQPYVMASDL